MNNFEGLIPNFKSPQEAIKFLHIPKKRKCIKCKGKKEQNNGNAYWCDSCLKKQEIKNKENKKSQEFYRKNPHLIPLKIRRQLGYI